MSLGAWQTAPMKNTRRASATKPQLDLTLPVPESTPAAPSTPQRSPRRPTRPCSRERAAWWFQQMRRAIEEGTRFDAPGVF
jgi:DNA-directed RNA polymerase subunit M/transcription elongation factor TFIIS